MPRFLQGDHKEKIKHELSVHDTDFDMQDRLATEAEDMKKFAMIMVVLDTASVSTDFEMTMVMLDMWLEVLEELDIIKKHLFENI